MRLVIVWTIFRKELLEALRDRRTLVWMVLVPLFLYPLFAVAVSELMGSEFAAREARASRVAVWGELPPELGRGLEASGKLQLLPWAGAPADLRERLAAGALEPPAPPPEPSDIEEGDERTALKSEAKSEARSEVEPVDPLLSATRAAVSARDAEAVLIPSPTLGADLARGGKGAIAIYYDSVTPDSDLAQARIERALQRVRKGIVAEREVARGMPQGFSRAYDIVSRNVAAESRQVGSTVGMMMPMMLILMALLGSFLPAIDLTAGEKERGTMQTLLCAPLHPIEIITGKFLAVWSISLLTGLANVVSLALTTRRLLPEGVTVAPSIFALTFVLLIPVTMLSAALALALAVFAKDFKDAQNALMPAYFPLMLLAGLSALPVVELTVWTTYVPVLNIAVLIKSLFMGDAPVDLTFATLISSTIYACLGLLLAARVFEREQVLLGGHESARAILGLTRRAGGTPSIGFSLAAFAAIQVLFFYGSLFIAKAGFVAQILAAQLGFFLVPTLAAVLVFGYSPRATLALRPPRPGAVAGALLVGVSAWAGIGGLILRLFPPPEALSRELGKTLLLDGQPFAIVLLVVALVPAVCEELLFRGLVYSGLRRVGPAAAIVGSALVFGLVHGSVYRLLPTFALGLALGYARHRTGSIVTGMMIHALNNGILTGLATHGPAWMRDASAEALPWSLTLGGTLVALVGLGVLRLCPTPQAERAD